MNDLNRNTEEVIMQIHNMFRYADPVFKLTTVGAVKLIQFLARMVRERKLSAMEFDDFGKFLKATDGKYDIMNIPAVDRGQLLHEMENLDIHYMIMPDLDKKDGLMQVAVYQPDRDKFGAWYERYLMDQMQGGEKELKELRGLTRGNVSIVSFPLEGREDGMEEDFIKLGINYAKLPDLRVGDGSIQMEIANADMGKVNQWYKLKQRDMLKTGEDLPPMETITQEQYQQTGVMTDQAYMDTASEELQKANLKYEGRTPGEAETLVNKKDMDMKNDSTTSFHNYVNDPDFIPVTISRKALVDQSVVSAQMREELADRGYFCCRVPGTWEKGEKEEKILLLPLKQVFEADNGNTFIGFQEKRHRPLVLNALDGTGSTSYVGMSTVDFVKQVFHEVRPEELVPERLVDPAKSLAKKTDIYLKQPSPPVMAR